MNTKYEFTRGFEAVVTAVFLEAWYQREESNPPTRETFLVFLALNSWSCSKFLCSFAYGVGWASKTGTLSALEEGMNDFTTGDNHDKVVKGVCDSSTRNEKEEGNGH